MNKYLLIFLFPLYSFSQQVVVNEIDEFTKDKKIKVTCTKTDRWKVSDNISDDWMGLAVYLGAWHFTPKGFHAGGYVAEIGLSGSTIVNCFSEYDGKIIWLFEDGDTCELKQISRTDCGTAHISARFTILQDDLNKLITKKVKKLRIYTTDGYSDYTIKEKKIEAIQQTFALLKDTVEKQ